jgi:predicted AAA+ superfamily ATPase
LEHLQAHFPDTPIRYWRDKPGREVDFVLARRRDEVDDIECKWNPGAFDGSALKLFRSYYPKGRNYLVTPSGDPAYSRRYGNLEVQICTPTALHP